MLRNPIEDENSAPLTKWPGRVPCGLRQDSAQSHAEQEEFDETHHRHCGHLAASLHGLVVAAPAAAEWPNDRPIHVAGRIWRRRRHRYRLAHHRPAIVRIAETVGRRREQGGRRRNARRRICRARRQGRLHRAHDQPRPHRVGGDAEIGPLRRGQGLRAGVVGRPTRLSSSSRRKNFRPTTSRG